METGRESASGERTVCQVVHSKLLSICMTGRSDDYTPDFRYRITTTLDHFACNLKNLGRLDAVELLITDWGSPSPLSQTLCLSPEAGKISRFIYVPQAVIHATQDGKEYFHQARALNVALRRAQGHYLLVMGADLLFLQHSLDTLLRFLEGSLHVSVDLDRTLLLVPRLDVPWQFLEKRPSLEDWDRYLLNNAYCLNQAAHSWLSCFGGAGGFMLCRDLYHDLRGLDERFSGYGWSDTELGFRVTQNYPFLWLSSLGITLFHMNHSPTGRRSLELSKVGDNGALRCFADSLQVNDESWGLGEFDLEVQRTDRIFVSASHRTGRIEANTRAESPAKHPPAIVSELQSPAVCQHVKRTVRVFVGKGKGMALNELDPLFFLAWYSSNYFPRQYLDFGVAEGYGVGVVTGACPSVEVYGVDQWQGSIGDHPVHSLMHELGILGFSGYIRFISSNLDSALVRLDKGTVGVFEIDLALIRGELLGSAMFEQAQYLLHRLRRGGALVITHRSKADFGAVWNRFMEHFPNYTYFLCKSQKCGMIIDVGGQDGNSSGTRIETVCFEKSWLPSLWVLVNIERRICRPFLKFVGLFVQNLKKLLLAGLTGIY